MPDQHQPDQELLQQLLLGQLPSAEAERLSVEYADDSRLARLAESIVAHNDTLVSQLKDHETLADSGTDKLVQRLQQRLQAVLPSRPHEVTAILSAADSVAGLVAASVADRGGRGVAEPLAQTLPERLEYYRPTGVLGQGGMGTVYLALDTRLGREVALKTLRPDLAAYPQAKERFLREARTAARLDHDNVIPIYYVGESDGTPFLAMPLLKGEPLDAAMVRKVVPFSVPEVIRIARETASGLAAAHRLGLIHRDIKPGNIWLEAPSGRVKILDFGLAKAADTGDAAAQTQMTANGAIVGTPAYMAPEQAAGRQVDPRADLFSLGCVIYQLLTARRPFTGPDMMAVLSSLATHTPPAPHTLNAKCPEGLSQLTMQLLEKDPAQRPESAVAVIEALDSFDRSTPTIAPAPQPAVAQRSAGQGNRVGLFALVALLLAGVGGYYFGGTIIRIATNKGELVVQVDDPSIKVGIVQNGVTVEKPTTPRKFTLTAGDGEIEVVDDDGIKLTTKKFELTRGGVTLVKVTLEEVADARKPRPGANPEKEPAKIVPTQVATKRPDVQPRPAAATAQPAKPFVVLRKDESLGKFGTLYGALSTATAGEVIEVHSNGLVTLAMPEPITKALHLRAGKGFRPLLVMKQRTLIGAALTIEGCDVDHRTGDWMPQGPLNVTWTFRRCRFWGGTVGYLWTPKLVVEDCIFDTAYGFDVNSKAATEITISNCAVQCTQHFLGFMDVTAPVSVHLTGNTFRLRGKRALLRIDPPVKVAITVKADGNVIEFRDRAHNQGIYSPIHGDKWQAHLQWVGRDNLYCGSWYAEVAADGKVLGEGLSAWNRLWKQPETSSREIGSIVFDGSRSSEWSASDRLARVRASAEQMEILRGQKDLGPDWELVGVGDSYLRALAAQGRAVPEDRLRPDAHADGPIVIIRKQAEFKGFPTLTAALEAAESGDILEIRTDDPIPGAEGDGKSRQLTLRAAPGYTPIINSRIYTAHDRLALEGLTFRAGVEASGTVPWSGYGDGLPFAFKGAFERISNCMFLAPDALQVSGWFRGEGDETPEITNCVVGLVCVGLPAGKRLRIKNSIVAGAWVNGDSPKEPGHLEIFNCFLWQPDAGTTWGEWSILTRTPLTIDAKNSVFVTTSCLIAPAEARDVAGWTGSRNVYIKPGEFIATGDAGALAGWQKSRKSDADSIELRPFSFDPRNWRVRREGSPGYQPRAHADFGVDVDRLAKAITVEQPATPGNAPQEVSGTGPLADRAKPFVVVRKDQSIGEFRSLFAALSATASGDVIEVHANGPVLLSAPEAIAKALHLRGGKGYRPQLSLKQLTVVDGGLIIEDCDVDHRVGTWATSGPSDAPWEFRRCRFWGLGVGHCQAPKLIVEDCLFDTRTGFTVSFAKPTSIAVTNCAISTTGIFLSCFDGAAPATVSLRDNTFRFSQWGHIAHIQPQVKSAIKFEATHNLVDMQTEYADLPVFQAPAADAKEKLLSTVEWLGIENLYCGNWRGADQNQQVPPPPGRLADWNKRWKQPEQRSQDIAAVYFSGARTAELSSAARVGEIQAAVERIKSQTGLKQVGPDWSLVGVGDSYLRALAARGQAVPREQLRPEPHAEGPIVILRKGAEVNGFLTLTAALAAAVSGDIIEIRTDDAIPAVAQWEGSSRRLTLRAGPGYTPSIQGDLRSQTDRVVLEGLTLQGIMQSGGDPWNWSGTVTPKPSNGCFERITNCVCWSPALMHIAGWFRDEGDQAPEITNCVLGVITAGLAPGKTLRIKNSVLTAAWMTVDSQKDPCHLELSDSLLWNPDRFIDPLLTYSLLTYSPLTVTARNSVLTSTGPLVRATDVKHLRSWTGSGNVYIKPGEFAATADSGRLEDWQKSRITDSGSVELRPFTFDVNNWRVWRERSPEYKPRADGADFGADIDRLVKAITDDQAAKMPEKIAPHVTDDAKRTRLSPANADRRAAEWVLSIGGTVWVAVGEAGRLVATAPDLPREPFQLLAITLLGNAKVTDAGLEHCRDCVHLQELNLGATAVSDEGLKHFRNCPPLVHLSLSETQITDIGLGVFKDCSALRAVSLDRTQISDAGLANFRASKDLVFLDVGFTQITNNGLANFRQCVKLTHLNASGTKIDDAGLAMMKACTKLVSINLSNTDVTDAALQQFAGFPLTLLMLVDTPITDAGLAHLKGCQTLEMLWLKGKGISDAGLAHVSHSPKLRSLRLEGTRVSDTGLKMLQNSPLLTNLFLPGTRVSDARLLDLAALPLVELDITNTRISRAASEKLSAVLTNCKIEWSEANRLVVESILKAGGNVTVSTPGKSDLRTIKAMSELPPQSFEIRGISLANLPQPTEVLPNLLSTLPWGELETLNRIDLSGIADLDYQFLLSVPNLHELVVSNAGMIDAGLKRLPRLPALERIVLDGNPIRGAGLTALNVDSKLVDVSLACPQLSDLFASNLAELKQVRRLSLAGSGLGDASLKHLAGLTKLETLDLRRTKVTAAGVAELKSALPKCQIEWDAAPGK